MTPDTGSEPRTEAGRRLAASGRSAHVHDMGQQVALVEAEAAGTADARLARVVEALRDLDVCLSIAVDGVPGPDWKRLSTKAIQTARAALLALPDRAEPVGLADGVDLPIHIRVSAAEMASWQPERISAFFAGIAKLTAAVEARDGR